MTTTVAPVIEARDADALMAALERRLPGYVDAVAPRPGGAGHALLAIYARYLQALGLRIDDAPDKNVLAFLDQLGLSLLPAQAARAPVVFETIPGAGDGRAPAGTRLGARGPDPSRPLIFETERPIVLAQARLAEVATIWPGRDSYASHTRAVTAGTELTLWDPLTPTAHELYVGHDLHLALAGAATVEIEADLAHGSSEALELEWSYFDGSCWRSLGADPDGTQGLTRSGRVRLHSDCASAKPTTIAGHRHMWARARLARPFAPGAVAAPPELDRLLLRTTVERPVEFDGTKCAGGLVPEQAYADGVKLDLTKTAFPLGHQAGADSALYLACEEAFGRPGAQVTVCVQRARTAEDTADDALANYELGVAAANDLVQRVRDDVSGLMAAIDGLIANELADNFEDLIDDAKIADVEAHCQAALDSLRAAAGPAQTNATAALVTPGFLSQLGVPPIVVDGVYVGIAVMGVTAAMIIYDVAVALRELSADAPANLVSEVDNLKSAIDNLSGDTGIVMDGSKSIGDRIGSAVAIVGAIPGLVTAWAPVAEHLSGWPASSYADAVLPGAIADAEAVYQRLQDRVDSARNKLMNDVKPKLQAVIDDLADLSPITLAAAAGVTAPKLADPQLVWEYWNGTEWRQLVAPAATDPQNLLASGTFGFTAPEDWTPVKANEVEARWVRARIASGAYARIRTVSWEDQKTKEIKFMAVVEPRPPALDALRVGYTWTSAAAEPQRCITLNDFRYADRTAAAAGRGDTFAPFVAMEERTPTLYLGFDAPLPAGELGVLFDVEEAPDEEVGPPLVWEAWDRGAWHRLSVEDETAGLALPGVATVLWPGYDAPLEAVVVSGSGTAIELLDERAATRFGAGEEVWLAAGGKGQLRVVESVLGATVTVTAPLDGAVGQGTLAAATLPRFGVPRTWLRARLRTDGDPRRARIATLAHNAAWASQVETVNDELAGSSDGQPNQAFFVARPPVLAGQVVELRELDGPRAVVEYPELVEEAARQGIAEAELRVVRDPRTRAIREVWVPWRERPHLFFSGSQDRHYTMERTRGRVQFGDGVHGRVPAGGQDNVRVRQYRSGGGPDGNVAAGAISQVLAGVLVQGVRNPRAAEGGAASEPPTEMRRRGPLSARARRQAVTAADYEVLAREASPAVAVARAVPAGPGAGPAGRVSVVIVPRSAEPRPLPSFGLRRQVREVLRARVPASLGGPPAVIAPRYLPVGVSVALVPAGGADAGAVAESAAASIEAFLHPLTGGPGGDGWPFGRGVHASDVAALVERLDGVSAVVSLTLLLDGGPLGDHVAVPGDRLVCAGPVSATLDGGPL